MLSSQLGISQDSDNDIKEMEEKLKFAKTEYFRHLLIYNAFRTLLKNTNVNNVQSYMARDQTLRAMEQKMVINESLQYLHNESGNMIGVTENEVKALPSQNIDNTVVKDEIVPQIQKQISTKAEELFTYTYHSDTTSSTTNDKLTLMMDKVITKVNALEDLKRENVELNLERQELLQEYFVELTGAMNVLMKVVEEFPLDPQLIRVESRVNILSEKLQTISQDVTILNLVLHRKIYSPEQRKNLNLIRNKIRTKEAALDYQIYDQTSQLASYKGLGEKFLNVAEEYSKLLSELDILKWAEKEYQVEA